MPLTGLHSRTAWWGTACTVGSPPTLTGRHATQKVAPAFRKGGQSAKACFLPPSSPQSLLFPSDCRSLQVPGISGTGGGTHQSTPQDAFRGPLRAPSPHGPAAGRRCRESWGGVGTRTHLESLQTVQSGKSKATAQVSHKRPRCHTRAVLLPSVPHQT